MPSTTDSLNAETPRREGAEKIENVIAGLIIDAAIEVHRSLDGPGLLESVYEEALCHELKMRDVSIQAQVQIPVIYKSDGIERVVNDL